MFGLVGLPCMWCWLALIHLKILKIQETSKKQFTLVNSFNIKWPLAIMIWCVSKNRLFDQRQRILSVHYSIPDYVRVSKDCKHLLSLIFVANPDKVKERTFICWSALYYVVLTVVFFFFFFWGGGVSFGLKFCRELLSQKSKGTLGFWRTRL